MDINISNISLINPSIGAILITSTVSMAVYIQLISNKWFSNDDFEKMQNVGGIYMSAVGTLYSVVLGMILVNASGDFSDARRCVEQESSALVKLYYSSIEMPERYRSEIVSSISKYVDYVLTYEWDRMSEKEINESTTSLLTKIWYSIKNIEPETENQKAIYPLLLQSYEDALDNRIIRITYSNYSITGIEWFCLISGGIVIIFFSLFFSIRNKIAHAAMTGMVAFMVSINLYAVYMLSEPFNGFMYIPKERFLYLVELIKEKEINPIK